MRKWNLEKNWKNAGAEDRSEEGRWPKRRRFGVTLASKPGGGATVPGGGFHRLFREDGGATVHLFFVCRIL